MTDTLPPNKPCTEPRHVGPIREQLGCVGPDPAAAPAPIEVGQTYRPSEDNAASLPDDRATITRVWPPDNRYDDQGIAFDIATIDYRGRPITTHSAMPESAFRRWYVLDAPEPEPAPESPAAIIDRALALLDSVGDVAYVLVRSGVDGTPAARTHTRGLPLSITETVRHAANPARFVQIFALPSARQGAQSPTSVDIAVAPPSASHKAEEQQRAKTKVQVLREVAASIQARNRSCNAPSILGICPMCAVRDEEFMRLRKQAADIEASLAPTTCTCGVPTDPNATHRADAPCSVKEIDQ